MSKKPHSRLWLYFTGVVFVTVFAVFVLISLLWFLLYRMELVYADPFERRAPIVLFALGSLLLGAVIAVYVGKRIIHPVQTIGTAFEELAKGNFSVKVPENARLMEIREMSQRFNAMTYDLSHIETLRSDFVANVSHEFKTPIAAIEGYATLLQTPALPPEKHDRYVEIILENSRRLSRLSGNILMLSKLENRETVIDKTEYRLDEQIRRCILTLESKWTAKSLEFDMELPRCFYYGSEPLLEQVWLNLLDNAIKFSPIGGILRITLTEEAERVLVSIADQGCGLSEDVRKHMFDKFYQGDTSHKADGNGLGLSLVKRIVELCHGSILAAEDVAEGAEFQMILPKERRSLP